MTRWRPEIFRKKSFRKKVFKGSLPVLACQKITINNLEIELQRKRIKNINLRISAKTAQVVVSASPRIAMSDILKFLHSKIDWVWQKQQEIQQQIHKAKSKVLLSYQDGEMIQFFGRQYQLRLEIIDNAAGKKNRKKRGQVEIIEDSLVLNCSSEDGVDEKREFLEKFYRKNLLQKLPEIIAKYEPIILVKVNEFGVKKMRTRYGSCNVRKARIWLSLDMAKRSIECVEFIVVHEMTHLLEANHSKRFYALMDKFLSDWKIRDAELRKEKISF